MTGAVGKQKADFSQGSISSVVLSIALPMMAAQMVNVLYNIVDRIYIGHIPEIGTAALTGVGIALPLITILSGFAGLFGQGGAPLFSIARGRGDETEAGRILGNAATMLLVSSIVMALLFRAFSRPALLFLGAGENTIGYAEDYLHIYLLGTPFVFLMLGLNPYINAQGFARRAMLTVVIGAGANILLDPVFIFLLRLGAQGAAMASVLSQIVSAVWCLSFLLGKKALIPLRREQMVLRGKLARQIISMGVSNFIAQSTASTVHGVANRQLFLYGGDLFVGAMTVLNSMRILIMQMVQGLTAGVQPVLGFNYGAGRKDRVLAVIRFNIAVCAGLLTGSWLLFELFPDFFVRIFTGDAELRAVAVPAVRIYFCGNLFMAMQGVGFSTFQGLGKAREAVIFSILRKIVIVVPLMLLLPRLWGLGAWGVFCAEPVSDLLGGGASFTAMMLTVYLPMKRELREEQLCKS